jgi:hypothetical protein
VTADEELTVQAEKDQSSAEWNEEFPLEAYGAVYSWIDKWSEEALDPDLSAIALAASESLYAVGMIVFETMRSMGSQIADETDFKAA